MSSFWMETLRASVLKRLRKTITIPAFAVRCGEQNGSFFFTSRTSGGAFGAGLSGDSYSLKSAFTVEMWLKTTNLHSTAGTLFGNYRTLNGDYNVEVQMLSGKIKILLRKGGVSTVTSAADYPTGEWFHLAVVYDGTTAKIYVDNVLDANTLALAANLDTTANNIYIHYFGNINTGAQPYVGYMTEPRVWNVALTKEQLYYGMNTRRGFNAGLLAYYKLNDFTTTSTTYSFEEFITSQSLGGSLSDASGIQPTHDVHPGLVYGASFAAARFTIEGGRKLAIKYPVEKPEDTNFQLVIAWVDDEGEVHRFKLWDMEGVAINPPLQRYRGETIPETFYLEAWNVDGASDVTLEDDLVIYVSKVTIPTHMTDTSNQALVEEPSIDISLGEPYPLVFPLDWSTEIWGTVESPVTKPVGTYSTNLPVYGAIQ